MSRLRQLLRGRAGWLATPALCLALASAWTVLYIRTGGDDGSSYTGNVALLRQIKQLDAEWELNAMKSRIGLNQNYDPLVDPLAELGDLPRQLNLQTAGVDSDAAQQLRAAIDAYQRALQDKAALVESFKSHNAVLRNSLAFLPTSVDDIAWQSKRQNAPAERVTAAASQALLAVLIYCQAPSDGEARDVASALAALTAAGKGQPADMNERVAIFIGHANAVMREQIHVRQLLDGIVATPTAARIDEIGSLLSADEQAAVRRLQTYRLTLSLLAAALIGLVAWVAARLIGSHATINRVNTQLKHANDHLERRVQERTDELVQSNATLQGEITERKQLEGRLIQSEKLASIGQLAAGIAHEINNPLAFLASNFSTLERYMNDLFGMLDAYERAEAEIAAPALRAQLAETRTRIDLNYLKEDIPSLMTESRGGMERVRKIIQNLKDFSHVESEQQWQLADLLPGLRTTLNIVASELRQVADVSTDYGATPDVECLPSELNQVFMNLMLNAAHAIGPERGRIAIRTGGNDDEAWVEVADTGSGIPAHVLPRIFDPFYTTKAIGKGTGLGLSLSYGIVQKHGGRIEVDTTVGQGTTFRVTLPVRQVAAKA